MLNTTKKAAQLKILMIFVKTITPSAKHNDVRSSRLKIIYCSFLNFLSDLIYNHTKNRLRSKAYVRTPVKPNKVKSRMPIGMIKKVRPNKFRTILIKVMRLELMPILSLSSPSWFVQKSMYELCWDEAGSFPLLEGYRRACTVSKFFVSFVNIFSPLIR